MHVTLVHVQVKPERVEEFIAATRRNHAGSIAEPGNLRFDVLQDPMQRTSFSTKPLPVKPMPRNTSRHPTTWSGAAPWRTGWRRQGGAKPCIAFAQPPELSCLVEKTGCTR